MLTVKNSRKRHDACSPAAEIIAGSVSGEGSTATSLIRFAPSLTPGALLGSRPAARSFQVYLPSPMQVRLCRHKQFRLLQETPREAPPGGCTPYTSQRSFPPSF